RAHLPEYPAVQTNDRARQRPARHGPAIAHALLARGTAVADVLARTERGRRSRDGNSPVRRVGARGQPARHEPRLRSSAPTGNRPRARHAARTIAARRTGRWHEPRRSLQFDGTHPKDPRPWHYRVADPA